MPVSGKSQAGGQGLGPHQLAAAAGLPRAAVHRARELGLLPPPDLAGGRWSAKAAQQLRDSWPQIADRSQAASDMGAARAADMLAQITGLPVTRADVEELAARSALRPSRSYKGHPLYLAADLTVLAADPAGSALLARIIAGRQR